MYVTPAVFGARPERFRFLLRVALNDAVVVDGADLDIGAPLPEQFLEARVVVGVRMRDDDGFEFAPLGELGIAPAKESYEVIALRPRL